MDKIKFAQMINRLTIWGMREISMHEMQELNDLVKPDVPQVPVISMEKVDVLLAAMKEAGQGKKIEAIKAYREITNAGLRESKEAVERYM